MKTISFYRKFIVLLILISLSILFSGCHKDYIYINNEFGRINTYNSSKTELAFFKFIHIAKPPKNFGTQKTIYRTTALFTYNFETKGLKNIFSFEALPYGRDAVKQEISYRNNIIAFSLKPISNWKYKEDYKEKYSGIHLFYKDKENIIRLNKEGMRPVLSPNESNVFYLTVDSLSTSLWVSPLKNEAIPTKIISDTLNQLTIYIWKSENELIFGNEKHLKMIELSSMEITEADTSDLIYPDTDGIHNKQLAELTKNFSYKDWGIDINKSVPKSKKERINDITTEYGGPSYRMAVFQEIKESLTVKEINRMLDELTKLTKDHQSYVTENIIEQLNFLRDKKE